VGCEDENDLVPRVRLATGVGGLVGALRKMHTNSTTLRPFGGSL
jgi:hypothetical protein